MKPRSRTVRRIKFAVASILLFTALGWALNTLVDLELLSLPDFRTGPKTLNDEILSVLSNYPEGFVIPVEKIENLETSLGVTREIRYQGRVVAEPSESGGVYCVGMIFDVYMAACEEAAGPNFALPRVSSTNIRELRREFYGFYGNKKTMVDALTVRGLGQEVPTPDEARAGDLIQFWRDSTGHSAVFLEWEKSDSGIPIGVRYWSAQTFTGIGENTEFFRSHGGSVDPSRIFIVRAFEPI